MKTHEGAKHRLIVYGGARGGGKWATQGTRILEYLKARPDAVVVYYDRNGIVRVEKPVKGERITEPTQCSLRE